MAESQINRRNENLEIQNFGNAAPDPVGNVFNLIPESASCQNLLFVELQDLGVKLRNYDPETHIYIRFIVISLTSVPCKSHISSIKHRKFKIKIQVITVFLNRYIGKISYMYGNLEISEHFYECSGNESGVNILGRFLHILLW